MSDTPWLDVSDISEREFERLLRRPVGEGCGCVAQHSPSAYIPADHHVIPLSWNGPDVKTNLVRLCPNSHTAVHRLIDEYVRAKGLPPWEVRRKFSEYQRFLAQHAWDNRPALPTITSLDFHA